jgi:heme exporter protein CcmD
MSYLSYVVAAYGIFALALLWDLLSAHRQVRRALRQARARQVRQRAKAAPADSEELLR